MADRMSVLIGTAARLRSWRIRRVAFKGTFKGEIAGVP